MIQVHLGDTGLVIEVEKDYTVYGDECKFGGGKVRSTHSFDQQVPFFIAQLRIGCLCWLFLRAPDLIPCALNFLIEILFGRASDGY